MDHAVVSAHANTMKFHSDETQKELSKGPEAANADTLKVHAKSAADSAVNIGMHIAATSPPKSLGILKPAGEPAKEVSKDEGKKDDDKVAAQPAKPTVVVPPVIKPTAAPASSSGINPIVIAVVVAVLVAVGYVAYKHFA